MRGVGAIFHNAPFREIADDPLTLTSRNVPPISNGNPQGNVAPGFDDMRQAPFRQLGWAAAGMELM
jgi:hypothetical protein